MYVDVQRVLKSSRPFAFSLSLASELIITRINKYKKQ